MDLGITGTECISIYNNNTTVEAVNIPSISVYMYIQHPINIDIEVNDIPEKKQYVPRNIIATNRYINRIKKIVTRNQLPFKFKKEVNA